MAIKLGKKYTLAPLAWRDESREDERDKTTAFTASTVFCELRVEHWIEKESDDSGGEPCDHDVRFSYCVDEYYDEGNESVESIEAGKRRAEEWYVERIKAAFVEADE